MGLDMYLTKRRRGSDTEQELVAYWRKANQIHGWFERNTTDGYIENCELYPVCTEDLRCLMADCRMVLENPHRAPRVLPNEESFFFGNQTYDGRYFENLAETERMLAKVVAETTDEEELFYHAWW